MNKPQPAGAGAAICEYVANRDLPIGLRHRVPFMRCDRCQWTKADVERNGLGSCQCEQAPAPARRELAPCIIRKGSKPQPQRGKRRTELGDRFTPRPVRASLLGQCYLTPNEKGHTGIKRNRKTTTGGVNNPSRPFVVVRISTKNGKRVRDFHAWCNAKGLVTYPLEFTPEEVEALPSPFKDAETVSADAVDHTGKPRPWPHYWEVCGPLLALLALRQHRSVRDWFKPQRGVMPNPVGQGQSKQ